MKTGKITARKDGIVRRATVRAIDSFELTIKAIEKIMKNSRADDVWAKGLIILKDENGKVLHTMAEKV